MKQQSGFTYMGVLLAIALLGIGLVAASEVWVKAARQQRMEQLDWVGQQYVQAIGSYYEASPGRTKVFPTSLQDLIEDRRFSFARRHLRSLYANPFTGTAEWELIRAPGGGIRGVRVVVEIAEGSASAAREFAYVPTTR
ncbi:type II secretion system protein [Roseateles sp. BYS78W]|uniref:Type II secretion system protein n=1 Tax=Pelomonas candidula TaxID=3299025 RepID=A0ABW7HI81_9BURK